MRSGPAAVTVLREREPGAPRRHRVVLCRPEPRAATRTAEVCRVTDIVYVVLTIAMFALLALVLRGVERL